MHQTPRDAIQALVDPARAALQCVARAEVRASTRAPGSLRNLVVVPFGNVPLNTVRLRRTDRTAFVDLEIAVEFTVVEYLYAPADKRYQAVETMYMHAVRDLDGRELFAYHWHPLGLSSVDTPHMHVSSARPVALPNRRGSMPAAEMVLSRIHFPTHRIALPELVRFLITELNVGPRRPDWEAVIDRLEQDSSSADI